MLIKKQEIDKPILHFFKILAKVIKLLLRDFDIVLNGMSSDDSAVLAGFTSIFPSTDYVSIHNEFVVAAHKLIVYALKCIEMTGGLVMDGSAINAADIKSVDSVSCGVVVSAIAEAAMRKAIGACSSVSIAQSAEAAVHQYLYDMASSMYVTGEIADVSAYMLLSISQSAVLDGCIVDVSETKTIEDVSGGISLLSTFDAALVKNITLQNDDLLIGGEMEVQSVRLRKLGDLDGMTLGDLSGWTMYQFYFKEE